MNKYTVIIAQVCAVLLALIVMILLALDKGGIDAAADGVPPEVDAKGLCNHRNVASDDYCKQGERDIET